MLVYITDHTDWWSFSIFIRIWSPKFCNIQPDMVQELWVLKEKTGKTLDNLCWLASPQVRYKLCTSNGPQLYKNLTPQREQSTQATLHKWQDFNNESPDAGSNHTAYLLHTPWCRVLPEQLTGLQLVKKFPAFHGTRRFITALISVRHLFLSWASPIQSTCPHPTSWRSILIL